ncbi:MvaI/BcnI family restriction endonuclease [Roseivivax marinus]|uniref:MvaI/BcnI family restriction endonuclease n=1 Tax=Roseivivax marinus TaxID=1379903 RepID=UPI00273EBC36|nr:MvaI/BcnI family restriction endonuclease [Roseivivax marinus]
MLEKSDTSIAETLAVFTQYDLEVGLLVPTETGMQKSIMDATAGLRDYFRDTGFHDYDTQTQGPDAKVIREAFFVRPDGLKPTRASLYRPMTKSGDPRVWFGRLKGYADPYNLLAVLVRDNKAYVVNCSDAAVLDSIHRPETPLGAIALAAKSVVDPVVAELLEMIRDVSAKGFIRTLRVGDTGVGMTLETLLGIKANSKADPDYKGIELKARRNRGRRRQRAGLFSKSPNWKLSPVGSASNFLKIYGYVESGRLQYYNTISAASINSHGLMLSIDVAKDWLVQNAIDSARKSETHVITWPMPELRKSLSKKHKQTFWVSAKCRGKGVNEEFHYHSVEHTKAPNMRNFDALIESGSITVDYTISDVGGRADDHGYLFKLKSKDMSALFPPPDVHVFT